MKHIIINSIFLLSFNLFQVNEEEQFTTYCNTKRGLLSNHNIYVTISKRFAIVEEYFQMKGLIQQGIYDTLYLINSKYHNEKYEVEICSTNEIILSIKNKRGKLIQRKIYKSTLKQDSIIKTQRELNLTQKPW